MPSPRPVWPAYRMLLTLGLGAAAAIATPEEAAAAGKSAVKSMSSKDGKAKAKKKKEKEAKDKSGPSVTAAKEKANEYASDSWTASFRLDSVESGAPGRRRPETQLFGRDSVPCVCLAMGLGIGEVSRVFDRCC